MVCKIDNNHPVVLRKYLWFNQTNYSSPIVKDINGMLSYGAEYSGFTEIKSVNNIFGYILYIGKENPKTASVCGKTWFRKISPPFNIGCLYIKGKHLKLILFSLYFIFTDETSTADTTVFGNNTPAPATSTNVGAIVFSVLCVVLVILSGILLVIFWRNRR